MLGRLNRYGQLCSPTSLSSLWPAPLEEDDSDGGEVHSVSETCTKFNISVTDEVIWPRTCAVHAKVSYTDKHAWKEDRSYSWSRSIENSNMRQNDSHLD